MSEGFLSENDDKRVLNLNSLQEHAKGRLVNILNSIAGTKTLVLEPCLAGPLGLLIEISFLKHHSVDKLYWLEREPLSTSTDNIIFLSRPNALAINIVVEKIKYLSREGRRHHFTLLLVPQISSLATHILEDEGILGDISVNSFPLHFIPVEEDVISLENDFTFREIWVDGDETVVYHAAEALISFQGLYGVFRRIIGKGDCAAHLASLLQRLPCPNVDKSGFSSSDTSINDMECLIIFDRKVDMITPMLTQLTYEGLIDEMIGIRNSHVELPVSFFDSSSVSESDSSSMPDGFLASGHPVIPDLEKKRKYRLSSIEDKVFADIRDCNFSLVGRRLNKIAHRLDEDYKKRLEAKTIAQLRDFVGKLGGLQNDHQSLRLHTALSERLVSLVRTEQFNKILEIQQNLLSSEYILAQVTAIEEMISEGVDMRLILRLLCLTIIITGGLKAKVSETVKSAFLQTYGYDTLPLLMLLESPSLGPISLDHISANAKFSYLSVRNSLQLVVDISDDIEESEDISYVYSGYAPLSVRLIQCVLQKAPLSGSIFTKNAKFGIENDEDKEGVQTLGRSLGWKGFEDVLANIPGETFHVENKDLKRDLFPSTPDRNSVIVIFYLGGCTYAEISAIRSLGKRLKGTGRHLVIATSGIISGSSLIDSISGSPNGGSLSKVATL